MIPLTRQLAAVDVLREWLGEDSGGLKQRLEAQAREALAQLLAESQCDVLVVGHAPG